MAAALTPAEAVATYVRRQYLARLGLTGRDPFRGVRPPVDFSDYVRQTFVGDYLEGPHLPLLRGRLEDVLRGRLDRLIISLPRRHGKALAVDTPIPTPRGWVPIGELQVGDTVFSEAGAPCRVIAVSEIFRDRELYRVRANDGAEVLADGPHRWAVGLDHHHVARGLRFSVRTTAWLADRQRRVGARTTRPRLPLQGALLLPRVDLPLDPYVLGLWLGDGSSWDASLTIGPQDQEAVLAILRGRGQGIHRLGGQNTYYLENARGKLSGLGLLKGEGGHKHVPHSYLWAEVGQRLDLLRGLVDADGYVAPGGQVEFCSTRLELARAVQQLVLSLGYKASLLEGRATLEGRDCSPKWRVMFYTPGVAMLERKCRRTIEPKRRDRYISVEAAGLKGDTVCIAVDSPSRLFLAGTGMLPTHNTEHVTRFAAAYLGHHPERSLLVGSANQDLADEFSLKVRDQIGGGGWPWPDVALRQERRAVRRWRLAGWPGGLQTTSPQGAGAVGHGAHVAIIDDYCRNWGDALSPTVRDRTWSWYDSVVSTSLEPPGAVVIVATRWHEDDLIGRLLEREPGRWEYLRVPAAAEPGDPLGREEGAWLWPQRFGEAYYRDQQATRSRQVWAGLFQQRPGAVEGTVFHADWLAGRYRDVAELGRIVRVVITLDSAYQQGVTSSYSADAVWAECWPPGAEGARYALLDAWRERLEFPELEAHARARMREWPQAVLHVEDKASGQSLIQVLARERWPVEPYKPTAGASKAARADAVTPPFRAGLVLLPEAAPWLDGWVEEHLVFPGGRSDDWVDTTSMALDLLWGGALIRPLPPHVGVAGGAYRGREDRSRPAFGAGGGGLGKRPDVGRLERPGGGGLGLLGRRRPKD